ncbi:Inp2p SKDI_13G2930 [Saccharomyces kudriavzevii IFO 1802]|uniref:Inheritance of peroxisomes protein 2 n=1 Tax=Saccharomyces kudriavzevii (strain ATCC MYA-4449 / AS 2.2408 / CBS 8840 / NBRC 1802 / NCYC 2889) TaxID=226230 RepID=A0AA35J4J6_SACK1|nr:uncharacterized protein SKDI_13G2930 [Saccharomyces kudriavzevii IFO 1802]CAI4048508.1 hypothetical protein SKDI_13G2930 [Saccharomyces kudriavzevii IFO 1802]
MAINSRPPPLQVPGLQIFSKLKSDEEDGFISSSSTLGRDTISGIGDSNRQEFYSTWRKPSQLSSRSILNEYSPTIIGSNDRIFSPISVQSSTKSFNWDNTISEIFTQNPFSVIHQFFEEFQYSIITSHFLNDLNHYRLTLHLNQSIMNFHKSSAILQKVPLRSLAFLTTKYGKLAVVENKNIYIKQDFHYLSVLLTSYRVLRQLKKYCKKKNDSGLKRVLSSVLVVVYLSMQQEHFRSHLICYKTLIEVQKVLKSLQQVDVMVHKYHLRYKEIKNYRIISRVTFISNADEYSSMVEELLTFSSDALFYKLKTIIGDIVILSNTSELSKYCELYGIDISNLYYNTIIAFKDLDGKLLRLKLLKKFMLCCLLSLDMTGDGNFFSSNMQNALNKIFPDYMVRMQQKKKNSIDTFQRVTNLLKGLNPLLSAVLISLNDHKQILYALPGESWPTNGGEKSNKYSFSKSDEVFQALNYVKKIENDLLAVDVQNGITETYKSNVQDKLEELIRFWKGLKTCNNFTKARKTPITNTTVRGFHLDILKGRQSSSSSSIQGLNLEKKVEFINVNESENEPSENDIELENDEVYNCEDHYYDVGIGVDESRPVCFSANVDCKTPDFKQLSDNELRRKLDERILKLARENREGRERLRTAKSFELLRKTEDSTPIGFDFAKPSREDGLLESGSLSKCKVSSEETIPFLYELEGLLGNES